MAVGIASVQVDRRVFSQVASTPVRIFPAHYFFAMRYRGREVARSAAVEEAPPSIGRRRAAPLRSGFGLLLKPTRQRSKIRGVRTVLGSYYQLVIERLPQFVRVYSPTRENTC